MKDVLVDSDGDLLIVDGDLVIGDSDEQNQRHLILASKGEYKRNPEIGGDLLNLLDEDNPKKAVTEIKKQLEYDGAKVNNITYKEGKLDIDAKYK